VTASGAGPDVLFAAAFAIGLRFWLPMNSTRHSAWLFDPVP